MNRIKSHSTGSYSRRDRNPSAEKVAPKKDGLDLASLWNAYFVSKDESIRNDLLLHYLPLARTIARQLHGRMPASVEYDDLAQAATLGLRAAIATFDPARGIPFENYCGPRVRGSMLDHLRSLDWAPRMLRSRFERMREMSCQMEMSTGTLPSDEQLSSALDMPLDELTALRGQVMQAPIRIRMTHDDESGNSCNIDTLAVAGRDSATLDVQRADMKSFLMRGLSDVERNVVMMYYYEDMSLKEIGSVLHLCESRVSQIHQAVIGRLRERSGRIGGPTID